MKMAELARRADVPVATIKFYLREGLLTRGSPRARNQADYSDAHVERLRLIRVMTEVGGFSLGSVKEVVIAVGDERRSLHEVLGAAHHALSPAARRGDRVAPAPGERRAIDDFMAELGWEVAADAPARDELAAALAALRGLGRDVGPQVFLPYAQAAYHIAEREVGTVTGRSSRDDAVAAMVIGTVVFERVLVALRRLAQEHHSAIAGQPCGNRE